MIHQLKRPKGDYFWVEPAVDMVVNVETEPALAHSQRLCELINTESVGVLIMQGDERPYFLAPYWWNGICMGSDARKAIEELFEGSKSCQGLDILTYLIVAQGYIRQTTPESAKACWWNLLLPLEFHPHEKHWNWLLEELRTYWDQDHPPKLVTAAFAEDRKMYLYFTDGSIRLVDLQGMVRSNTEPDAFTDEEFFRFCMTLGNEALVWLDYDDLTETVFSSEQLWEISQPVDGLNPEKVFPSYKPDVIAGDTT